MSEERRYEALLQRIQALESRMRQLEQAGAEPLDDAEALADWNDFLLRVDLKSLTRTWRELETDDLYASVYGLGREALAKLKQSMSANAWRMLVQDVRSKHPHFLAHAARLRILETVQQLKEGGEISYEGAPAPGAAPVPSDNAAEQKALDWEEDVLVKLA